MTNHSYSIYIRTLGKGGEKYSRLLRSIDSQTVKPEYVTVVLPNGVLPPPERLGYEHFSHSEKGMVRQRVYAVNDARTPYVLLLDDDVEFESQYVEKMFRTMEKAGADCCIPVMTNNARHNSGLKKLLLRFMGSETHTATDDNYYMSINRAGGFVVKTNLKPGHVYYSQTGHGSNCFASVQALRDIRFEDELWLEDSIYALPDDQVMFYKMFLNGSKIAVCQDVYFCHLDAASTNDGKRYLKIAQAKAGNYLIFWYRFIFRHEKTLYGKTASIFRITHRLLWENLLYALKCHNAPAVRSIIKGIRFGIRYIRTDKLNHQKATT